MEKDKFSKVVNFVKNSFEQVTSELVSTEYTQSEACQLTDKVKVAVIVGISGYSKGRILLQGGYDTVYNFALAMNDDDPFEDPKEMYFFIAEFANMFSGRTITYINNEFKECEVRLTPPAIFSGEDLELITPTIQSETIHYSGKHGSFLIDVGFEGD